MTERGGLPCRDSMTRHAIMRELTGYMVWTGDRIEFILMTTEAIRRETFVLPAGMTRCAGRRRVRTDKRERRRAVIES